LLAHGVVTYGQLALEDLRGSQHRQLLSLNKSLDRYSTKQDRNMAAQQKDPEVIALARTFNHTPTGDEYEKMISGML
jgi:hypothetical protein